MKGISTALVIVVTIIVLLAVAVVVLTFFGVNIGNLGNLLSSWIGQTGQAPTFDCEAQTEVGKCSIFSGCQWCGAKGFEKQCARIGNCKKAG